LEKCVIIELKDRKTGKTVKRIGIGEEQFNEILKRKKESGDLGTNSLGRFLQALFTPMTAYGQLRPSIVDENGNTFNPYIYMNISGRIFNSSNYGDLNKTIKVGDSAMPPSREQYNLQGTILGENPISASWEDGGDYVDLTASFSWTEDKTIYEIGLFYEMVSGTTTPTKCKVMLDRTVYPEGIFVPAGQVLTITYRIMV